MTVLFFTACRNDKATSEQPQQQQQTETISEQGVENQVIEPETTEPITYVFKPKTFKPIDESKKNAALRKTLNDLLTVIKNKDLDGLKPFLDANILVSLGGEKGWNDFLDFWKLKANPENSMVWQELKNAITLGGTFDKRNPNAYTTPYLFLTFDYDAYEYAAITGDKVNIRDKPTTKSKVIAQLNYDVVKIFQNDANYSQFQEKIGDETHYWFKIQMADGKTGYVWGKFCRMAIDYRATFSKVRDEGWKMTSFVAGD